MGRLCCPRISVVEIYAEGVLCSSFDEYQEISLEWQ